ncbi:MAG: hypothetical protein HYR63_19625 [Proteobacteria bacterium]|nr:hypothetical protein [Pseudomonadota bacterium]MBI3498187.1 hypothetical protein [Pseudomonadota bacterium]
MDGEDGTLTHQRRVQEIGGWLSLAGRLPHPVDRPGPVKTAKQALEGTDEKLNPFPSGFRV